MPIRRESRYHYPIDWSLISREVRFGRAKGRCEGCGRPHGREVRCLPDGRWYDTDHGTWRDHRGQPAVWPDIVEACVVKRTRVILAACHLNHDPTDNRAENLKALCQRCHLNHDREYHRRQFWITIMLRRAVGDFFLGPYRRW